jgi:uncharacterized protein
MGTRTPTPSTLPSFDLSAVAASLALGMPGSAPAAGDSLRPSDWLLLLLALRDASKPLDPVRLQKGLFLLGEEAGLRKSEAYRFEPYDYGPFSAEIYRDLQDLMDAGYAKELPVPGYSWKRYTVTPRGIGQAEGLLTRLDPQQRGVLRRLAAIKAELLALKFNGLLRRVYSSHPDYAVNSVFRYTPHNVRP